MSIIKISIKSNSMGQGHPRTEVSVDGKFAYHTGLHPIMSKQQIEKIIELAHLENIEVVVE